jgi:predicted HTH domain antitoxin
MLIDIDLPKDFVEFQTESEIRKEMRTSYALWLFQRGRVTLSKAAELAGFDLYDFMAICKANGVPVIDISREELLQEMISLDPI